MTVMLVRRVAKEIAGAYYEDSQRTELFRKTNPDQDAYVAAMWPHFHQLAIQQLSAMLGMPGVPDHQKEEIFKAILEDRQREFQAGGRARTVIQATADPVEREDRKAIDQMPGNLPMRDAV